jgi:spore germination protein GerM
MDITQLREINRMNKESAQESILSAEKVLDVVMNTFPLYILEPLVEAAKMDVIISNKIMNSYEKEEEAIKVLGQNNIKGYELYKKQAQRRKSIYMKKKDAAFALKRLSILKELSSQTSTLGVINVKKSKRKYKK